MISGFLAKQGAKIVKKEIDKRGGIEKIAGDVSCSIKTEVDKHGGAEKIVGGLTGKVKSEIAKHRGNEGG